MRVVLGGADVDLVRRDEVRDQVLRRLSASGAEPGGAQQPGGRPPLFVASANLDHLYHFGIDSGREGAFDGARADGDWLVLLDGAPLARAARRLTGVEWEVLAGSDLLPDLLRVAARARARIGVLGGDARVHRMLRTRLAADYPHVRLAGMWAPTRDEVDDPARSAALAAEIADAGVDLLVVGLGKPRQEEWLLRHGRATGVRVAVAFGAAADFLAGAASRAPVVWRQRGFEWLYRLLREPRRLARRYLVQGPSSLWRLWTQSRTPELTEAGRRGRAAPLFVSPAVWRRRLGRWLAAADALVIALASLVAYVARGALGDAGVVGGFENEMPAALAVAPLWLAILHAVGAYRPEYLNTGGDATRRFAAGAVGGLFALGFASFALNLSLARLYVALLFSLVVALGGAVRLGVRAYLRSRRAHGRFVQNVVVAGADDDAVELVRALRRDPAAGYRPVGFVADDLPLGEVVVDDLPVLGRCEDVLDVAYDHRAGLVVVSPSGVRPGTLRDVTIDLEGSPVDLAVAPSLFQVVSRRVRVESVANVPVLHVDQIRLSRLDAAVKRAVDLTAATVGLLVAAPLLAVAAAAVRLDTPGPVIYRQERVGRDGGRFTLLKLRTMVDGADGMLADLAADNEGGDGFFKMRRDPRVTRVGRVLRRWSLDELPQLLNVLRGDISMVGPRPPIPDEVEKYEPWQLRRLRVRPGVTGVWQTSGRSEVPFDEAVRLDLFYIENWSLGWDLFLLAKTVVAVARGRGAW